MRSVLRLEYIGYNRVVDRWIDRRYGREPRIDRLTYTLVEPYVRRVTGLHHSGRLRTERLDGQIDYSDANSCGSRGVHLYYWLSPGLYEVREQVNWKRHRIYYVEARDGECHEITLEQMHARLRSRAGLSAALGSMF